MKFTKEHAALIVEAHEIEQLLDNDEEAHLLEENNPDLFAAYQALVDYSEGIK